MHARHAKQTSRWIQPRLELVSSISSIQPRELTEWGGSLRSEDQKTDEQRKEAHARISQAGKDGELERNG